MHLTNYAINKHSKDFVRDDNIGSKRRIVTVNRWFEENNYPIDKIWADIEVNGAAMTYVYSYLHYTHRMSSLRQSLLVILYSSIIIDLVLLATAELVLALRFLALTLCWIES